MEPLTLVLGGIVLGLVLLIKHLRRNHGSLEALGLPVSKPFLFFGSPPFLWNKVMSDDPTSMEPLSIMAFAFKG